MKKTYNPARRLPRVTLWLLCVLLVLSSLCCLPVHGAPSGAPAAETEGGATWVMLDEAHTKISGDGVIYEKITLPWNCEDFAFSDRYIYANLIQIYGYYGQVSSFEKGGYLLRVEAYYRNGDVAFYCRPEMKQQLQDYAEEKTGKYVLRIPYALRAPEGDPHSFLAQDDYYDITVALVESLKQASKTQGYLVDVTQLKELDMLELRHMDPTGMLTTLKGVIYAMPDGTYGYVDYATLDNSHFDADGHFSYRSGQVTVYDLGKDFDKVLEENSHGSYHKIIAHTYEQNELSTEEVSVNSGIFVSASRERESSFYVQLVFWGYMVPIAPLTVGLVLARSPKMGHPKRWYAVSGMSVLWILLSVLLTVVLLV